jgi:transcriptional regulator
MFIRPEWRIESQEIFLFIEAHPWAIVVNNGAEGPYATNLPMLLDRSRGDKGTLVGHIARPNPHCGILQAVTEPTLAIFEGPSSYVTASWYPDRDMPSTVYYTAVHCYGRVREQSEAELERWIGILTEKMESRFENGWKITEVEDSAIKRRLKYILGFEIEIERIEAKFKLGQDEPKKDALAVAHYLAKQPERESRELADLVLRYNINRENAG